MGVESFAAALDGHRLVGADAMLFIYQFESHERYAPLTQVVFDRLEAGQLAAVASVLCLTEVLTGPGLVGRQDLVDQYRLVFEAFPGLTVMDVTGPIADRTSELRAQYRIRTPDAIHLSTALAAGATALVSNDTALRQVSELSVLVLEDFA